MGGSARSLSSSLRDGFREVGAELRALAAAMPIVMLATAALEALQANRDGGAAARVVAADLPRATFIASPRPVAQGG
jgi:hypothetical protein